MASSTPDTRADSVEDVSITNTSVNQSQDNPLEESEEVLGVSIHRCSPLQPHRLLQHPLVKIHIVDGESGLYVSSTSRKTSKAVSTRLNYVAPTATQACSLNKKKPIPVWEEMITIKELTTASLAPSTILFFEVVDFSPAKRDAPGWHYIAWAFLKVCSPFDVFTCFFAVCVLVRSVGVSVISISPVHFFLVYSFPVCFFPVTPFLFTSLFCFFPVYFFPVYFFSVYFSPFYCSPVHFSPVYFFPVYVSPVYVSLVYFFAVYCFPVYYFSVTFFPVYFFLFTAVLFTVYFSWKHV
jgi:hypothetical protein